MSKTISFCNSILSALVGVALLPTIAFSCERGPDLAREELCDLFVRYVESDGPPAPQIASRLVSDNPTAPVIRSFALVVDVNTYPNFSPSDRFLAPAKNDLINLKRFLVDQKFDEIIVLENEQATPANIRYFLIDYLLTQVSARSGRARVLFAYSGHGAPARMQGRPGALVLSNATSSRDPDGTLPLSELEPMLSEVAAASYHFVALIGSCYSGGIFPSNGQSPGENNFYTKAPGSHAVSATTSDDLAYGLGADQGSIFFDTLINGVESGWADPVSAGMVSDGQGRSEIIGGGIARLGSVTGFISGKLEGMVNPKTQKEFPQIRYGNMNARQGGGAFFFLVPSKKPTSSDAQVMASNLANTGSAIGGHPDIKVFSAPDTYSVTGIDLSHHSGRIAWPEMAKAGIQFAYMKATEGANFVDDRFSENWSGAQQSGIATGAYHVVNFCKAARDQFENIKRVVPKDANALPIAIDLEWFADGPRSRAQKNCARNIAKVRKNLHELLKLVSEYYGKPGVVYAHEDGVKSVVADQFDAYALWLQNWTKDGTAFGAGPALSGRNPWTLWQFAGETEVGGHKNIDLNAFFGTAAQFAAFKAGKPNIALAAASGASE